MAQLTIYIDTKTIKKIEKAAKEENVSVSKWVREILELKLNNEWPASYFSLFGSLGDSDLQEAEEMDFKSDIQRGKL